MKQFTDSTGKTWDVAVTIGSILRVKDLCQIDLLNLSSADDSGVVLGTRITTEPLLVSQVLYAICQKEAHQRSVDRDAFLELLDGKTLADAFDAFAGDLTDFFQESGRTDQARILEKQLDLIVKAHRAATLKVETIDVDRAIEATQRQMDAMDLNKMIAAEIETGGKSSGNTPASSELTRAA